MGMMPRADHMRAAVVLAPFFVHLEIMFKLGYRPDLHKDLNNDVSKEIASLRRAEAEKKRAKAQ
jgi:uncharacterized membrane protein YGL010W